MQSISTLDAFFSLFSWDHKKGKHRQLVKIAVFILINSSLALPVVDNEEVVGVISIGDVVKTVIADQKSEINSLRSYIGGGYPT